MGDRLAAALAALGAVSCAVAVALQSSPRPICAAAAAGLVGAWSLVANGLRGPA